MADSPRSSFIPKQATSAVSSRTNPRKRFNVFGLIATVLLLGALVLAGGTYFFKNYTLQQLEAEKVRLADARGKFNEADIVAVRELDRKLNAANFLLERHISPSKIFDTLELTTKTTVQFAGFSLQRLPSDDVSITLIGATEEFKSVALQKMQFGSDPIFSSSIFTELASNALVIDEEGIQEASEEAQDIPGVSFNVTGTVAASRLRYSGIGFEQTAPAAEEVPAVNDTSTSTDTGDENINE